MSFVIGGIEIQMMADLARLKQDMDQAKATVSAAAKAMQSSADLVKGAFIGIASGLTLHAFNAWMKGAIDAADATKAFAQKTGVAAAEVAGLQLAFKQGGVGSDQLTTSMSKLQKQMVEGNKTFDLLGVATRNADGSMRSTKAVLYDTADAFAGMADGSTKSTLAMEIFGKTGAEMIPTLNEGAAGLRDMADMAARLGLVIDGDTAEAADRFNDTTELLGLGLQGIARQTMAQLLPALNSLAGGFLEGMTAGNALTQVSNALATGMKGLYTVLVGGVQIINTFGKTLGALGGQLAALATGDFKLMMAIGKEWMTDIKTDWQGTIKNVGAVWDGSAGQAVDAMAKMTKTQRSLVMQTKEQEAAAQKAAAASAKQAEALMKLTVAGDQYLAHQRQANDATQREIDLGRNLTAAELAQIDLSRKLAEGKLLMSAATQASTRAEIDRAGQLAETKKWLQETTAENIAAQDAIVKKTDAVRAETEKQIEANAAIGLAASSVGELRVARLLEMAVAADKKAQWEEEYILVNGATSAQRELAQAYRDAAANAQTGVHLTAAKEASDEWKKVTAEIGSSLTDALFRAFESGKGFGRTLRDSLVNTFKTMVLRPIISAIVNPVAGFATGALGLSGAASAGTSAAGSAASSAAGSAAMSTLASMFPSLAAGASAFGNTLLAAGQSFIGMAGTAAQTSASLAAAGYGAGTASGSAIAAGSSAGSALVAAVPYVAIAAVVANALGLFRSKRQTDSGLVGTLGSGNISDASVIRTGGTLFKGPDYRTNISGISAGSRTLQDAFEGLRVSTAAQAAALGVSTYSIRNFTTAIGTDVINNDAGTKGLRLQGLTAEQAQAKIAEALQSANEQLAALALAGSNFGRNGETAVQTLARLSGSLSTVNGVLGVLGGRLYATSLAGGEMASKLAELFGGLSNFQSTTGAYFDAFFSEAERAASLTGQLSQQMRALGFSMPSSREGFRKLVEAQDLTTDAGRRTYASLLQLSGAFAVVVAESDASTKAADRAAAAAQRSATALSQRLSIEERILRAQGNTAELRRRELAALDATNRVLQQRLYDIEDAAAAAEEAGKLRDAWRSVGDTIADEVARMQAIDTGAGTAISDGQTAYTQATAAFTIATAQARSGVLSAAEALPELARKLLDLAGASAHSSAELALAHSSVGASLLQTAAIAGALGSPKTIGVIANPFEGDSHSGGTYENPFSGAIGDAIGSIAREIREFFHINYSDTVGESGIDWANLNGYASGGYHAGGLRIVGENGPELEATGPSRIYSADQTARLLSGGSDQGSMLAELRAQRIATARLEAELQRVTAALQGMRAETQATAVSTNKSTRQLQEVIDRGVLVRTDADTPLATVAA